MHRLLIALTIALATGLAGLSTVAWAQEVPATPEILGFDGAILSWTDESDNEDGFRILVELIDENGNTIEFQYEVDADVTSFELPPGANGPFSCPSSASLGYRMIAFNQAGDSLPSAQLQVVCPSVDFQGGPEDLPNSGTGRRRSASLPLPWLVAAGLALCSIGVRLRTLRSR